MKIFMIGLVKGLLTRIGLIKKSMLGRKDSGAQVV